MIVCLSACLSVCLPDGLPACASICKSVCQHVHLCVAICASIPLHTRKQDEDVACQPNSQPEVPTALQQQQEKCYSMLGSPDGKQGSLRCLPGGSALELLPKMDQVVALQHAKRDLKHLLQTLLPASNIGPTL